VLSCQMERNFTQTSLFLIRQDGILLDFVVKRKDWLIIRMFIQNNLKINLGFNIQSTSIVNFIASFFLGILVTLKFIDYKILLLFYAGFLGSFSTFSSFIYQLFVLFQKRKFMLLFFHYIEVIILSFLCFYLGYYLIQII